MHSDIVKLLLSSLGDCSVFFSQFEVSQHIAERHSTNGSAPIRISYPQTIMTMNAENKPSPSTSSPMKRIKPTPPVKPILRKKPAPKNAEPEHTIEDEGEDIAATALIGDAVVNLVTGDDEDESTSFILYLAAAGAISAIASFFLNKGNSDISMGIYLYMGGYAVLLLRIMPFYLIIGGLGGVGAYLFGPATTLVLWISLIALGVAGLCYLIRYLIPQHIMRIIKKISWVLMFTGPGIMLANGANITGIICMVVSALWFILFVSHTVISKGMEKISDAAVNRIASHK